MLRTTVRILLLSSCAAIAVPAWAHHSMVAFDREREMTLEGVVTDVKWTNPHMFVFVDVTTAGGKKENWSFEGGAVTMAVTSGISPKLLKVGTRVKIAGNRHLDATKHMALLRSVEIDGKVYGRNAQTNQPRVAGQ